MVLLGLTILVIGFLLRRTFVQGKRSRERDPAAEVRQEMRAAERAAETGIHKLEVRLHNYGREVEGRVQTTLTLLDRLIVEAEQETDRLHGLLQTSGQVEGDVSPPRNDVPNEPLTTDECRMVRDLHEAGYRDEQIARLLRRPVEEVESALSDGDFQGRADAA